MGRPLLPPTPQGRRRDLRAPLPGPTGPALRTRFLPAVLPCDGAAAIRRPAPDEDTAVCLFLLANTDGVLNIFAK